MSRADYRTRIYEKYASRFMDSTERFDATEAARWGRAYDSYFRGWLPTDKNAAIVDLACGGGKLLHYFKQRGYTNLTGVDISPEQVALSKQVVDNVVQTNVLDFLESKPATFDLITGLDIVEHLHKDEVLRFLDTCFAALKLGGRLILQTPNAESPWGAMHRYNDFTHEVGFQPNSLSRILALCGFADVESREAGPVLHGAASAVRCALWATIRAGLKLYNLAEVGVTGSGVFTRVFLIAGTKRSGRAAGSSS
jgi:2-polyprenyl-3-methyl-5-hydroxy-6-metoxy-1,4-benzoquinol methylase